MKIVILDSATLGDDISFDVFKTFGELKEYKTTASNEVEKNIADADVILTNKVKLNGDNLKNAKNLKLICVAATGFDNIDTAYAKEHNIAVCNVKGYSSDCVAQLTVSMVLSLYTKLAEYTEFVSNGDYQSSGIANKLSPTYHEIAGKKWGIVGFGNIGKKVYSVASALGCEVYVNKKTKIDGYNCVDLDTLCRECDIITIHTPLNDETRGLISRSKIAMMKDGVVIINVARGAVVDELAIADNIKNGKIGAFGCDVYSKEPFDNNHPYSKIKNFKNVCLTPHMAWGGYETRVRLINEMAENIKSFFNGEIRNRIV